MTNRRRFIASLGSLGGFALLPPTVSGRDAIEVEATPTVFRSHENDLVLVRFSVTGTDAPAGRLRVYDSTRRFLGTAGVLPAAGRLYGEFWVPIDGSTRISTDLEIPGRGPLRTNHLLEPPRNWVIHWAAIVAASELAERLEVLPPMQRAIEIEVFRSRRFFINPVPSAHEQPSDPVARLQTLIAPMLRAVEYGLPLGEVAMFDSPEIPPTLPALMRGSGIDHAITRSTDPVQWIEGPGGVRVLGLGLGPMGNPGELGFAEGPTAMAPLIERLIAGKRTTQASDHVLIASHDPGEERERGLQSVQEWNSRYAYPRIEVSDAREFFDTFASDPIPVMSLRPAEEVIPDSAALRDTADLRFRGIADTTEKLLQAGVSASGIGSGGFADIFALPPRGHIVVNATPYTRSDVARVPDGGEFIATHVPPMGYAYFPRPPQHGNPIVDSTPGASTTEHEIAIDEATGAIRSLRDAGGRQWVAAGGLNTMARCRLDNLERTVIPGFGIRLIVDRWSAARGRLRTVVSLYEGLDWIDIHNDCEGVGTSPLEYGFNFALNEPRIAWDLGTTRVDAPPPTGRMRHERYVLMRGPDGSVYFRGHESPFFEVRSNGGLVSFAPPGTCGFRLAVAAEAEFVNDGPRFGWGADPLVTLPASGAGGPVNETFGSLLATNRRDVAIVGLKRGAVGDLIVFLQDQEGIGGTVGVGGGLISFDTAIQCDLLERNFPDPAPISDSRAEVRIAPRGLAAVRLGGLRLRTP